MESQPEEKTINWDPSYVSLLGLDKNSFHRVLEDNYHEIFQEITSILKLISENVNKKNFELFLLKKLNHF